MGHDHGVWRDFADDLDWADALDDAALLVMTGWTGAVAGNSYSGGGSLVAQMAFLLPSMLMLWLAIGL